VIKYQYGIVPPEASVAYRFFAASLGDRGSAGGSTRGGIYWQATVAGAARPESAAPK